MKKSASAAAIAATRMPRSIRSCIAENPLPLREGDARCEARVIQSTCTPAHCHAFLRIVRELANRVCQRDALARLDDVADVVVEHEPRELAIARTDVQHR